MANLGLINNNPGNLRDPSTGNFQVFKTPEEGHQALLKDITLKQSGQSSHIKPGASIAQLGDVWAPPSDNNVKGNWATNVAKFLGVPTAYAFDQIPPEKLAEGIKVAEGTSTPSTTKSSSSSSSQSRLSHEQLTQNINAMEKQGAKPEEVQGYLDSLKTSGPQFPLTSQKDITPPAAPVEPLPSGANQPIPGVIDQAKKGDYLGALSSMVRKTGSALTGGGTETLGNAIGTGIGAVKAKATDVLTGSKEYQNYDLSAPSVGKTALAAAQTVAAGYGIKGAGALATKGLGLFKGGVLAKPALQEIINGGQKAVLRAGEVAAEPTRAGALIKLTNYLERMPLSEVGGEMEKLVIKGIKELAPAATKPSFTKTLLKLGLSGIVVNFIADKVFGGRIGSGIKAAAGLIK